MSTIRVVNLQHTDATEPNIVLLEDGTSVFASGITISGGTNLTVSGTAEFASGTVSAPGVTFIDDNNTGLYSPAADTVAITTSGTERVRVDSTGNVGIGSTPSTYTGYNTLMHTGSTGVTFEQRVSGALTGSLTTDSQVTLKAVTSIPLVFGTANSERMRIDSAGNVGIGTTSPSTPLHIKGAADSYLTLQAGAASGNDGILFHNSAGTQKGVILFDTDDDYMLFSTNNTERMRIDSSGKVGIGTTNPSNKFVVSFGGAEGYEISPALGTNDNMLLSFNRSGSAYCGNTQNASYHRWLNQDLEKARIDSSGRLLVGTSSAFISGDEKKLQMLHPGAGAEIILGRDDQSVGAGNSLGAIKFVGNAGSYQVGAEIEAKADGTQGDDDKPTRLEFSTTADGDPSPTERMRIASNGTSFFQSSENVIGALTDVGAGTAIRLYYGGHSRTGTGGTITYTVWTNGDVVNTNNSYGAISDIKLKENIVDANSQWNDLKALQVRNYNFIEGQTHTQLGLVAQEVELVSPGLVSESPDRDEDNNDLGTVTKSVNYSVLYMKAVKALQEAMDRIETLEQRLSDAGIA